MVREIRWTETAQKSLKLIFDYYAKNISKKVAEDIRSQIFIDLKCLEIDFLTGTKEPLLADFTNDYRYLISGNYKIIYFIDNKKVIISLIFDTRQNPQKLYKILKKETN